MMEIVYFIIAFAVGFGLIHFFDALITTLHYRLGFIGGVIGILILCATLSGLVYLINSDHINDILGESSCCQQ